MRQSDLEKKEPASYYTGELPTGRREEEDGKTLVCNKRDRAIIACFVEIFT